MEHGRDRFACSKARGGVCAAATADSAAFYLETGGEAADGEETVANNTPLCCPGGRVER